MKLNHFVTIHIAGEPVAQGRPRFTTVHGSPRAVDPKKSKDFKYLMRLAADTAMTEKGLVPTEKPLSVTMKVTKLPPKSWSKKKLKRLEDGGIIPIIVKPDMDNYVKTLDGLNGIVWADDNQIWDMHARKFYALSAGMEIEVRETEEE